MGFRVLYHLNSGNLKGVAEEAKWAESLGYDGLLNEVVFNAGGPGAADDAELRKVIEGLQG